MASHCACSLSWALVWTSVSKATRRETAVCGSTGMARTSASCTLLLPTGTTPVPSAHSARAVFSLPSVTSVPSTHSTQFLPSLLRIPATSPFCWEFLPRCPWFPHLPPCWRLVSSLGSLPFVRSTGPYYPLCR
ncbi:hypothetical protein BKA65DRAFT_509663 [Rhexocercosporidium sp. MPI-PUGE-AT-0058]|nr:hypothetical protein BKA65DRAFT_509663 [Rhexocercosporidium sp. MPI-PUGE-AT-0058]